MLKKIENKKLAVVVVIAAALFLRLYRIAELTEFLGDQGVAGVVIYNAWHNKSLPLVGPQSSLGPHQGPFYYYLIGVPLILFNFNPLPTAVFIAILGVLTVAVIYYLGRQLFGFWIGLFIASLYAFSPAIVAQNRMIWNPTPIPFFSALLLLSLYQIKATEKLKWFIIFGLSLGIIIQFHYSNLSYMALIFFFWLCLRLNKFLFRSGVAFLAFIAALFPFLYYHFSNNFADIKLLLNIVSSTTQVTNPAQPYIRRFYDLSTRIYAMFLPLGQRWQLFAVFLLTTVFPLRKKIFWHVFFALWYIGGIAIAALSKGVVFDHYLRFLILAPLLLLGYFLSSLAQYVPKFILVVVALVIIAINLSKTDIFVDGYKDIERTWRITEDIIKQSDQQPFSFTLLSSRSFSDLHYRYYFLLNKVRPSHIMDDEYKYLFLICEKQPCPTSTQIQDKVEIQAICYDQHCSGDYPKIKMSKWEFKMSKRIVNGVLYTYSRI